MPRVRRVNRFAGLTDEAERAAIVREVGRWVAANGAEKLSSQRLYKEIGLTLERVYRHWETFGALRAELGLPARKRLPNRISDEELMETLHRLVERCGQFPTRREMVEFGEVNHSTYWRRFGDAGALRLAYNRWLAARREEPFEDDVPRPDAVKRIWEGLRVGFASRMSGYRDRKMHRNFSHDFVVCAEDDWPGCPVPVVRLGDVGWDGSWSGAGNGAGEGGGDPRGAVGRG